MRKMFITLFAVLVISAICVGPVAAEDPYECPTYCSCGCEDNWPAYPSCVSPCVHDCTAACTSAYTSCMAGAWTPEEVADCAAERTACRSSCGA